MRKFLLLSLLVSLFISNLKGQECELEEYVGPVLYDTYAEYASTPSEWRHYNTHDPSIYKSGDWFYCYSTDAAFGGFGNFVGHLKRRSQDLVHWEFLGTAFNGVVPQSAKDHFIIYNPDYTDGGMWAPFIHKSGDEYRLYYCAPGGLENINLAFIGLATSDSIDGPWEDKGYVASSHPTDTINAIDPTVVIDPVTNEHWMAYGSYQRGIYIVELDPETGLLKDENDRGVRVAGRQGGRHASIEGPELAYRDGWFYLFVSYNWLGDSYNVRVGRSENAGGPYYDINGNDMAQYSDNLPMILAPYRFNDHRGWQGTGHNSVFEDNGRYFFAAQGRPSTTVTNSNIGAYMVMQVREIFWIDGWPVLSPQVYAAVPKCEISPDSIPGQWEHLLLIYRPSFQHNRSDIIEFGEDNSINGNSNNTWTLDGDTLVLSWNNGEFIDKVIVSWGWDSEYRRLTLVYTGMNQEGLNMWGKKIDPDVVHAQTVLEHGSTYLLRNHNSNIVLEADDDSDNANVQQATESGELNQEWLIIDGGNGYFQLSPMNSVSGRVLEVTGSGNGANFRIATNQQSVNQQFKLNYHDNGYFSIVSRASRHERGADVSGFSTSSGANVIQWGFAKSLNQLWRFERIQRDIDPGTDPIPLNDNANLLSITVNGSNVAGFNADELNYQYKLAYGTSANPVVAATASDIAATISITQAGSLTGTATIEVTAEDGITKKIYTVDFDVSVTSISANEKPALKIYPNPSFGDPIHIDLRGFDSTGKLQLSVYRITGEIVYAYNGSIKSTYTIDKQLAPGVYILTVKSGTQVSNQRLIVH